MDTPITISKRGKRARQTNRLTIGCLIFPRMDQIDFTGPFEVLSRIPNSTIHVIAKTKSPVRDIQGLILTPEMTIAEAPEFDVLQLDGVAAPFGSDHHAGIEDQSHTGGFNGSRWLLIAASRSRAKSPSSVAVEAYSFASRKDSESNRTGGSAGRSTATGSLPLSITTSAPACTRASTSAKLLAASASGMWITWSAWRDYTVSPPGQARHPTVRRASRS